MEKGSTPWSIRWAMVGNSVEALEGLSPLLPPLWVELEQGGHGVAVFMAQDLAQWAAYETRAQ